MAKPCKKFKYKEGRSNKPIINSKKVRRKISCNKVADREPLFPFYYGEYDFDVEDYKPPIEQKNTIEELRQWTEKQRFIPQDLSDNFLTLFLSTANFSVENASEKIKKFFFSRQEPSLLFDNRNPFDCENDNVLEKLYVVPMPGNTKTGKKILITGLCHPLMSYSLLEHVKLLSFTLDFLILENDFGCGDFVVIFNGNGFTCPQLLQNEVHSHRSITALLLDTIPGTLREFYLVSPPLHVLNVAENRNGISITLVNTLEEMSYYLEPDELPVEFGGNLNSFSQLKAKWLQHLRDNRALWIDFEKNMGKYYRRRLCHEKEVEEGGKNWVQNMKLEADEWEYKIKYYEKMRSMTSLKHPAYGMSRLMNMKKEIKRKNSFELFKEKCKIAVKEAIEKEKAAKSSPSKIRREKLEAKKEEMQKCRNRCISFFPILELGIRYY